MKFINALSLACLVSSASAFSVAPTTATARSTSLSPLFMGRAAAVRAATKGKTDAKKAKTNGIYGKKIIMAVKQGGPDTDANRQLADIIKSAKSNNVPVDNITRAIKSASEASTGDFKESTFEAYGFGGASMVINVLSDNDNRSNADVRAAVGKNGGKMAEQGSVLFMYDRKGKVEVPAEVDEEALMEAAIENDVDDYEMEITEIEDSVVTTILVEPQDTNNMLESVKSMGFEEGLKMELCFVTKAPVEVEDEDFEKNMKVIDALEELDDVDSIEHNMSN